MVADQRLNPTYTGDLAPALLEAVDKDVAGVVHLTSSDACSWFEFTEAIMEMADIAVPVEPVETDPPSRWCGPAAQRRARATGSGCGGPVPAPALARRARRLHA